MDARRLRAPVRPLVVLLAVLFAPLAAAEVAEVVLVARDEGHERAWFAVDAGRNPLLVLTPGKSVVLVLRNEGSVEHNLHLGAPLGGVTRLAGPGAEARLEVQVPEDAEGRTAYWCDPHRQVGMEGELRFAPAPDPVAPPAPTEDREATPAPAAAALLVALALGALLRERHA